MIPWIIFVFVLLVLVIWNNRRVSQNNRKRGQRSFRRSYRERKEERENMRPTSAKDENAAQDKKNKTA